MISSNAFPNCSTFFNWTDVNDNGYIGFHELFITLATFNIFSFHENKDWPLKMTQVNCSMCLLNSSVYYLLILKLCMPSV